MKKLTLLVILMGIIGIFISNDSPGQSIDPKYIVDRFIDESGNEIVGIIVPGKPPDDYRMPEAIPSRAAVVLSNVPGYDWSFGCSATSAAMQAAYYDRTGYYNMYTGPTQGGLMPMNNSTWGTVVINGETRNQCPLSATRQNVDGRTTRGHVDDYWVQYGSSATDPYITNGWTQHTWGQCTGDYMGTNQSVYANNDGFTTFYFNTNGSALCNYAAPSGNRDGCYGLRKFYESRGYTVLSNCSQYIYGHDGNTQGFTFTQYKNEINAGRPVLIQVEGHTMLGYGYDDSGNTVYLHDTWDYASHTMTWGGSYDGMQHYGVTTIQLQAVTPNPCSNIISLAGGGSANAKTYWGGGVGVWFNSSQNSCGYYSTGIEQVYSFVPPVSGYYKIQVTAASGWVDYLWKSGSCSSSGWTCIADISSPGVYGSMYMSAGTTYYILLDDENSTEGAHTFFIFYDPCSNITSIGGTGTGYAQTFAGGGNGAWYTTTPSPCNWNCPGREKVYSFVAPVTDVYNVVVTAASGWVDYMWKSGSCSSSGWQCIDDIMSPGTYGAIPMNAGSTYYILLDDENTLAGAHNFYLSPSGIAGTWTGLVNSDWHNSGNWSGNLVPDGSVDVTIPSGTPHLPNVSAGTAHCKVLTINTGATLNIAAQALNAQSDIIIYGTLNLNHTSGSLRTYSNLYWQSGSTANISGSATIYLQGIWEFMNGANVYLTSGYVDFFGSGVSYIRSKDADSHFNHLRNNKTGNQLGHSAQSTQPCRLNGNLYIYSNCKLTSYTSQSFRIGNFVNNMSGIIELNNGTFVFDGTSGTSHFMPGDYFNNVTISSSGTTTFDDNVEIRGNLLIESGALSLGATTLTIKGNWTNNVGTTGFVEGLSRVIFNGSGHQYVYSNENFNILEANMGAALRVNGIAHTVTCNLYDWTSGGIDVLKGTFTALDLAQDVLSGGFWVNPDATINLHQAEEIGQYVDLGCSMVFSGGGTINVYGGSPGETSWWPPSTGSGSLTMSGGVLDFKDAGINIRSSGTLTTNLTGGTIRTSGGFLCSRPTFTPTAGTFEFYGSGNYNILQSAGSLYNVNINKSASRDGENEAEIALYDKRSGELLSDGGRSGAISLNSNFMITNNLTFESGTLNIGAHELTVARNAYIDGTLSMTNASGIFNAGTYWSDWLEFRNGSVANITHGTINCYGWILPRGGSSFNLGLDNTLFIKGNPSGGLSNFEPAATYGNVVIAKNAGAYSVIDGLATEPVVINGDFSISDNNTFRTQPNRMTVQGEFTDSPSSIIQVTHSAVKTDKIVESSCEEFLEIKPGRTSYYLEIDSEFDLKGQLLINNTGTVYVHGRFSSSPGSSIHINNGSFISDTPNHADKGWQYLNGNLTLINGLFEITNNSVNFGATATTSVSGGVIRSGGAFAAVDPGIFQPTGGVVEIIGSHPDALIYCYNTNHFHNLTILRTGGYSQFMYGEPILIQNTFTVNSGEIRSGASEISVLGDVAVNSGGHLSISSLGSLLMSGSRSINVNDGGLLEMTGNITNQPKISHISSGHYAFNVESGGTIAAEHALFEYMDNSGINIKPGAIVDHSKAFHNCTFRLGQSGGRLLTINNSQTFAVNYASFPYNSWGGNNNVSKTVNSGVVTFMGYGGDFAGATFEQDLNNRIHWGGETAAIVALEGVEVVPGQDICFEATNTLTVGGGGSYFAIHNGGFVELVAGEKVRMLEGAHFHHGSYGLARITTTGDYCSLPAAMIASIDETLTTVEEVSENESGDLFFRVYPNPTTGIIMLEFSEVASGIMVEVFGMTGEQILKQEVHGYQLYKFDLANYPKGIYIVRVTTGVETGMIKLIKQ